MTKHKIKRVLTVIAGALVLSYVALLLTNKGHELPMQAQDYTSDRNRTVAIFGATGTIGDGILKAAMEDPAVDKIHVVTRRPSARIEEGVESGKVEMTIHKDYLDYTAIKDKIGEIDAVYWAIGLSAVGLDQETYREIHADYPMRFVTMWLDLCECQDNSFHYVSGSGADADSRMMWSQEKAYAEAELTGLAEGTGLHVVSYRPAFILPTEAEAHIGHRLLHAIFSPIGASVAAESIGAAMLEVSERGQAFSNGTILENKDIIVLGDAYRERTRE